MRGARDHTSHGVGDGAARVVLRVHAHLDVVEVTDHLVHDPLHLMGQRAAIGVAQHQAVGAVDGCRFEHLQRELWIALVAVEEVLRVKEDAQPLPLEELDGVADHGDAFAERLPERLGDVVVPRLAHDAHRGGAGPNECCQGLVVVDAAAGPACGAEGHQRGVLELQLGGRPGEELLVLGIRTGPAAFDPMDAERVELAGHFELVVGRHRDALELDAVAQRRVEDLDSLGPRRVTHSLADERSR